MAYSVVLNLHSWLRWPVVALLLICLFTAISGWRGGRAWSIRDRKLQLWLTIAIDLQFLFGLILWFLSPLTPVGGGHEPGTVMKVQLLRFFTVEHAFLMLLAVAAVHVGSARSRKGATDAAKFKPWAIGLIVATVLVLVAIPWPFLPYGRPLFRI